MAGVLARSREARWETAMRSDGRSEDGVSIDGVKVLRVTQRAILCHIPNGDEAWELWVPQSVVTDDSDCRELGDDGTLVVQEWFAIREGLA